MARSFAMPSRLVVSRSSIGGLSAALALVAAIASVSARSVRMSSTIEPPQIELAELPELRDRDRGDRLGCAEPEHECAFGHRLAGARFADRRIDDRSPAMRNVDLRAKVQAARDTVTQGRGRFRKLRLQAHAGQCTDSGRDVVNRANVVDRTGHHDEYRAARF